MSTCVDCERPAKIGGRCRPHYVEAEKKKQRVTPRKGGKKTTRNVQAVREIRALADEFNMTRRLSMELAILETLAIELDDGGTGVAGQFRQLTADVNKRIDAVVGTDEIDMIAKLQKMIDDNAKKRAEQGWE